MLKLCKMRKTRPKERFKRYKRKVNDRSRLPKMLHKRACNKSWKRRRNAKSRYKRSMLRKLKKLLLAIRSFKC